jgi:glyoxalase family protein
MQGLVRGIHHVTAIAGDPQRNLDFYAGVLGLHLVKKTVNFDAPDVYHLYYGDRQGLPGTILTFFPYGDIPTGRRGKGMLNVVSFSVSAESVGFWQERLARLAVPFEPVKERFGGEPFMSFLDPDGLPLELVFDGRDARPGWSDGRVPAAHSIKGFHGVEIWEDSYEQTARLLIDYLDHKLLVESEGRFRLAASDAPGHFVDVLPRPRSARGQGGRGTVHHIAFATKDKATQLQLREALADVVNPTPVIDRQYFTSIYFHEPGGVLFEAATVGPGFAVDEPADRLGAELKLPDAYEGRRNMIEAVLPPVALPVDAPR